VPQGLWLLCSELPGTVGEVVYLENADAVIDVFDSAGTVDTALEAFRGGCRRVVAYRLGTGGGKALLNLQDAESTNVVKIEAKYEGARGNNFAVTVRDSLTDATKRELLLHEGTTLRQTIVFAKGSGEPQALVDAVAASNSLTLKQQNR